jgi:hypothetical protein
MNSPTFFSPLSNYLPMKFSKAWLQTYSKETLPDTKNSGRDCHLLMRLRLKEITQVNGDDVLDIKVLPNRAHDALGHRGMARDICALTGTTFNDPCTYYNGEGNASIVPPTIIIADTEACTRFMSVRLMVFQLLNRHHGSKNVLKQWTKKYQFNCGYHQLRTVFNQ